MLTQKKFFHKVTFWLYVVFSLYFQSVLKADEAVVASSWQQYVSGFRSDHNFSLIGGQGMGRWNVYRFGSLHNRSYPSHATFIKLRYDFYLPLWGPFGYTLGSSLGYFYQSTSPSSEFRPSSALHWPGLSIGGVCQFSSAWRILLGLESYLVHPRVIHAGFGAEEMGLRGLMYTYQDSYLALDYFYSLNWASRFEVHSRVIEYRPPLDSENMIEDLAFDQRDIWIAMGLTYHLI